MSAARSGLGGLCLHDRHAYADAATERLARPDWEDWTFHVFLPFVAYGLLVLSSLASISHARQARFGVGVTTLLLLFIGIHNAWDAVAWQVFVESARR